MLRSPWFLWLDLIYSFIIKVGSNLQSLFLLCMRIVWGHLLFMTGIADLGNMDPLVEILTKYHFPAPAFHAYEFALIEAVGGILLFIGFLSRLAALPVLFVTIALISTAHAAMLTNFLTDPLILVALRPFPFMITALIIFIFGPGRISIDAWIKRWVDRQPRY
jgi:putative oxidoreductase